MSKRQLYRLNELIKSYRRKSGLTMEEFAMRTGINSRQYVHRMENSLFYFPLDKLKITSIVLDIPEKEITKAYIQDSMFKLNQYIYTSISGQQKDISND